MTVSRYTAYELEHLLALPVTVGTGYPSIPTSVAGWMMATTLGFLLATVFACTTNATSDSIVDGTCGSRDSNFWIKALLAGNWPAFRWIMATSE
jgi:hypothetical protein